MPTLVSIVRNSLWGFLYFVLIIIINDGWYNWFGTYRLLTCITEKCMLNQLCQMKWNFSCFKYEENQFIAISWYFWEIIMNAWLKKANRSCCVYGGQLILLIKLISQDHLTVNACSQRYRSIYVLIENAYSIHCSIKLLLLYYEFLIVLYHTSHASWIW